MAAKSFGTNAVDWEERVEVDRAASGGRRCERRDRHAPDGGHAPPQVADGAPGRRRRGRGNYAPRQVSLERLKDVAASVRAIAAPARPYLIAVCLRRGRDHHHDPRGRPRAEAEAGNYARVAPASLAWVMHARTSTICREIDSMSLRHLTGWTVLHRMNVGAMASRST